MFPGTEVLASAATLETFAIAEDDAAATAELLETFAIIELLV